jgi:hypothetical protein
MQISDWHADYCSFLLRLWRVGQANGPRWRVLLERVDTHEQRGFASLEEAFEYLQIILSLPSSASPQRDEGGRGNNDGQTE